MAELIALSVFVAVGAAAFAIMSAPRGVVQQRLAAYKGMAGIEDEEPPEADPTFADRLLKPLLPLARRVMTRVLPAGWIDQLTWRLTVAGNPMGVTTLIALWLAALTVLPLGYLFLTLSVNATIGGQELLIAGVLTLVGGYLPHVWLRSKAKQRQKMILKSLPDAIDLLTTSVEAGMGIDGALAQVAEKVKGPIAVEIRRVLRDTAMGSTRREALEQFARRTALPDVQTFVNAVVQAEQMGVSLGHVIRVQSEQLRVRRRQRAEQAAYKAPVKMVFPLVFFIFPAIFVVILGPAMLLVMEGLGGS
jgi:tight adherence protein C